MPYSDPEWRRAYHRQYHAEWYKRNKTDVIAKNKRNRQDRNDWWKAFKATAGLACARCGEDALECLDFHHTDATTKEREISAMVHDGLSEDRILAEIQKCIVLCSNCHRKLHFGQDETLN